MRFTSFPHGLLQSQFFSVLLCTVLRKLCVFCYTNDNLSFFSRLREALKDIGICGNDGIVHTSDHIGMKLRECRYFVVCCLYVNVLSKKDCIRPEIFFIQAAALVM